MRSNLAIVRCGEHGQFKLYPEEWAKCDICGRTIVAHQENGCFWLEIDYPDDFDITMWGDIVLDSTYFVENGKYRKVWENR